MSYQHILKNLREMPWLLRTTVMASVVLGVAFPIVTLIPGVPISINHIEYSGAELWASGFALAIWVAGPFMAIFGVSLYRKRHWTKGALVLMPVLQLAPIYIAALVTGRLSVLSFEVDIVIASIAWAVFMVLYLALNPRAKAYFHHVGT
jgi:hypothetical protein